MFYYFVRAQNIDSCNVKLIDICLDPQQCNRRRIVVNAIDFDVVFILVRNVLKCSLSFYLVLGTRFDSLNGARCSMFELKRNVKIIHKYGILSDSTTCDLRRTPCRTYISVTNICFDVLTSWWP